MTSLLDGLAALVVVLALNLWVAAQIRGRSEGAEGDFLVRTYWATLLLRFAGAILLNMGAEESSFALAFWGDSSTYDRGGYLLSLYWSGDLLAPPYMAGTVSGFGFHYVVALVYSVFGRNQLLIQFLNGTVGSLSVLVIYAIARDLFGTGVARWSALCMAYFPQMVFWSCAMYKDPLILLCIACTIYAVVRLREQFTLRYIALFIGACLLLMTLRFYVFYIIAAATLGTFLFAQRRGLLGGMAAHLVLLSAFLGTLVLAVRAETIEQQTAYFDLEKLQVSREDLSRAGSGFAGQIDVSTPQGAMLALPVGLVYLLFAPFPWAISGLRQALTLPETLVWYALMPALFRGLFYTIRWRLRDALPILVFAGLLTGAYAIFQSNVGTAYRQRTQVSMFYFMFMGVGRERRLRQGVALRPGPAVHLRA
jgi:hypothetical protein